MADTAHPMAADSHQPYARLAGILLLTVLVLALVGNLITSRVAGSGSLGEMANRIAASELLYRTGLAAVVLATLSSTLLGFALYATLKPVNGLPALLGMIFWVEDAFLGLVVRTCAFVRLHLYVSMDTAAVATQRSVELLRTVSDTTENLGGICFGAGSLLFFFLFFQSRYIPRAVSLLGLFASAGWIALYFATLILPGLPAVFRYACLPPMALADATTGAYLLWFGTTRPRAGRAVAFWI